MKKLLLVLTFAIIGIGSSYAWHIDGATGRFTADCGAVRMTVTPDFFQSVTDAVEYYEELNLILCRGGIPQPPSQPAPSNP